MAGTAIHFKGAATSFGEPQVSIRRGHVLASIELPDDISITEFLPHYIQQWLPAAKSF